LERLQFLYSEDKTSITKTSSETYSVKVSTHRCMDGKLYRSVPQWVCLCNLHTGLK